MMELVSNTLPIAQLVFYVATLFAPLDATHILVSQSSAMEPAVWTRQADGWLQDRNGSVWTVTPEAVVIKDRYGKISNFPRAIVPTLAERNLQPGESISYEGITIERMSATQVIVKAHKNGKPVSFFVEYRPER